MVDDTITFIIHINNASVDSDAMIGVIELSSAPALHAPA